MKRLISLLAFLSAALPAAAQETTLNAVVFVPRNTSHESKGERIAPAAFW